MIIKQNNKCAVCSNTVESIIKLPNFPLTGIFSDKFDANFHTFNQELQYCDNCKHCQLKNIIDPNILYSDQYSFLTSNSSNSRNSTSKFINFINKNLHNIHSILEFGCNDLYFLKQFEKEGKECIGIDPILNKINNDSTIKVIADYVENIDFSNYLLKPPCLICSQHTIEHIPDIRKTLEKLKSISNDETVFAFEFPNFDLLIQNRRFDQIFHEHVHYFSLDSFFYLLKELSFEVMDYEFNFDKWGTIYILFKNSKNNNFSHKTKNLNKEVILNAYKNFKSSIENCIDILEQFKQEEKYAYGASLMLPSLNYHFNNYLTKLNCILDDDENKKNKKYINIDIDIDIEKNNVQYDKSVILITALEHTKNISKKLINKNTKNIIVPINIY